jgi:transglutaminase-like putative cysteine protease
MLKHPLQRLLALPRDAQASLFLLGVIGLVLAPSLPYLPLWVGAMVAAALLWRGKLAWQARPLPGRWTMVCVLLLALGATLWSHQTLLGRDAGATLIVVLLALKTLELKAQRDAFVVFFLAFFCLLATFLHSQTLGVALAMLLALAGLLTALVNAQLLLAGGSLRHAALTAGRLMLWGAPVMALLFVMFPRVSPLWGVPGGSDLGRTGLSSEMNVGQIAQLAQDDSIAFRVRFDEAAPPQNALYFRGPVLSQFDGRNWRSQTDEPLLDERNSPLAVSGQPLGYEVTLESSNQPWLMVLDATPSAPLLAGYTLRQSADLQWLATPPLSTLTRYRATSYLHYRYAPANHEATLRAALLLPSGSNPRTVAWASQIRADPRYANADAKALSTLVLGVLQTQGFRYTLAPGTFGTHTADEFWFDKKEGFCEHMASSYVVLMRALGVPARVVTGYQGGARNALDGYWEVRQQDAHAWAEIWQGATQGDAGGWTRVDPTGAVAPGRIAELGRLAPSRSLVGNAMSGLLGEQGANWLLQLRGLLDAGNNLWIQNVLNFGQDTQLNLLKRVGFDAPTLSDLGQLLAGIFLATSLAAWAYLKWPRHHPDPWLGVWHTVLRALQRKGLVVAPALGELPTPRGLALHVLALWPKEGPALVQCLRELEALRYAPAASHAPPSASTLRTLGQRCQELIAHLPRVKGGAQGAGTLSATQ